MSEDLKEFDGLKKHSTYFGYIKEELAAIREKFKGSPRGRGATVVDLKTLTT